jgi:pimeloyl-ACP methyl ester carboxylesterase
VSDADANGERASLVGQLLDEFFPFAPPGGELPDPTPAEGPDPYGNPDPEWLRIDWREHLHRIRLAIRADMPGRSGPTEVNYVEMGDGRGRPTILFVHGLSGSWQNWLETLPHFAATHRVLAPDLPGFGHSSLPPWRISIERYAALLYELCDALAVRDCVLVGNSMGGFVSAEAACRDPGRFEKLVLVSAAGVSHARMRRAPAETAARMAAGAAPLLLKAQERGLRRPRLRDAIFSGLFQHPSRLRTELLLEQFQSGAGKPGLLPAVQGLVGYDILEKLSDVDVPTLIVWGRNDRVVPPHDAFGYASRLRNSSTVIFDDTGHLPQIERPVRFNRVLETFLEG